MLQFHNAVAPAASGRQVAERAVLDDGGVADCLAGIRDQGLARFIGFTALGDAACCRRVIDSGRFDAAQVYYNLLNPSAARAMPGRWTGQDFAALMAACRARDMGVIAVRVFAAGIIATEARHGRESVLTENTEVAEEERKARAVFAALGDEFGTRAQTAIRFVLANPDVSAVNIGLADPAELEEALPAAELGPLPPEALSRLDALYETDFA